MTHRTAPLRRGFASTILVPLLVGLGACSLRPPSIPVPGPVELTSRVRALLGTDDRSPVEYRRARVELEALGPEIDNILLELAYDPLARPVERANAVILIADRRVPGSLETLRWVLLTAEDELIRSAAVIGLHRLSGEFPEAENAIRSAVADPSPTVRINALQALDVMDVQTIRSMLRRETNAHVHMIAQQLLAMAEARGAPLEMEHGGVYFSTSRGAEPRLMYRPWNFDESFEVAHGSLHAILSDGTVLPLANEVEMVRGVLPAFFNVDRSAVVLESGRVVHVRDLERREAIYYGRGLAPRPVPLSETFLYLRDIPDERRELPGGFEVTYEVMLAGFGGGSPVRLGSFRVIAEAHPSGYLSPVRWMTIGESPEGWALLVDGEPVFRFPHPTIDNLAD